MALPDKVLEVPDKMRLIGITARIGDVRLLPSGLQHPLTGTGGDHFVAQQRAAGAADDIGVFVLFS